MPLDSLFLTGLSRELDEKITGTRIDKIQQPGRDLIILSLRSMTMNGRLLICGGSNGFRIHLTKSGYENPQTPPMFCMLLRKYLTNARIEGVSQLGTDRILEISLNTFDAMGMECKRRLILEFMGRYTNVILAGEDGLIIDCMHRTGGLEMPRSVLPGLYYKLPEAQNKINLYELTESEITELVAEASTLKSCDKWLLDTFMGLSPLICREVSFKAYGDTGIMMDELPDNGRRLVRQLMELKALVNEGRFTPVLLTDSDGKPRDFSFMEIGQYEGALKAEIKESFSELLEAFYTKRDIADRMRQHSQNLVKAVKTARDRTARRLSNQLKELEATENRELYRRNGDIIMANLHMIKRGDTVLEAYDFYSEDGSMCKIHLDPTKNPHQNASKYYKDYSKAKNARVILTQQTASGKEELFYLDSVLEELQRIECERDLEEIRQELMQSGYLRANKQDKKKRNTKQQRPMEFTSSTGMTILAGRNNIENDELTKSAFKRDIWLHTLKVHGSHVIIRVPESEADETTLSEAASIAAYYSQARNSSKVPVDYTQVRYVKKPAGSKPGMVIYTNQKTVLADPNEELVNRLRKKQ
ncbi:MAG: fibronectin/fibrinogen-binding protein [Ruminococcaceae bacterium]|nr:fibronectin/fibrinogen-binding protein [Oscillospiraceae bacterium]